MPPSGGSAPPPDYSGLAKQQAEIDQKAIDRQTVQNRPTQLGIFGNVDWAMDPETGRWIQKESLDPRVQGIVDKSLAQQAGQGAYLDKLAGRADYQTAPGASLFNATDPGVGAYDPKSGDEFSKMFTQNLLARVTPQQAVDRSQMETRLRLQGLQPGTEAYNRAYQNLLTSQGDVNTKAQLEGMLAGGQESRDIYNTRLNSAMALQENARGNYQTRMQGQNQMNTQNMATYLLPYQQAGQMQDLIQGQFGAYMPSYQGYGTAGGAPGADMMGAAQSQYAASQQIAADKAARRQQQGSMWGSIIGGIAGTAMGGNTAGGAAAGGAIGSYFSDAALKDEIEQISDETAYNAMLKVHPYSFSWPSGARSSGLVAQEIQQFFPHLVTEHPSGYLMVNYETFTALLLGAFRHLAKKEQENAAARSIR